MVQEEQASANVYATSAAPEKREQLKTYRLHAMTGEELEAEITRNLKTTRRCN